MADEDVALAVDSRDGDLHEGLLLVGDVEIGDHGVEDGLGGDAVADVDGGVHGEAEGGGGGVTDFERVESEAGIVDLVLSDAGDDSENTEEVLVEWNDMGGRGYHVSTYPMIAMIPRTRIWESNHQYQYFLQEPFNLCLLDLRSGARSMVSPTPFSRLLLDMLYGRLLYAVLGRRIFELLEVWEAQ